MGSSGSSSVSHVSDTLTVNNEDIKVFNKQVTSVITSVAMKQAKDCGMNMDVESVIDMSGSNIGGNLNVGYGDNCRVDLRTKSRASFDCVQSSTVVNEAGNDIIDKVLSKLESAFSQNAINKMSAIANQKAKTGSLSTGVSVASSKVNTHVRNRTFTKVKKDLQNVVESTVRTNFSSDDVQKCVVSSRIKQGFDSSGSTIGGDVNLCNFSSDVAQDIYGKCVQALNTSSKITSKVMHNVGLESATKGKSDTNSSTKSQTTQDTETTGMLQDFGGVIESVGTALGNIISGLASPALMPASASSSLCCLCICCIVIAVAAMSMPPLEE